MSRYTYGKFYFKYTVNPPPHSLPLRMSLSIGVGIFDYYINYWSTGPTQQDINTQHLLTGPGIHKNLFANIVQQSLIITFCLFNYIVLKKSM